MRGRTFVPLIVGLGIGLVAIKMFVNTLHKAKGASSVETVQVVRASVDVAATSEITAEMLEMAEMPKGFSPQGAFHKKEEVVGRVSTQIIPKGMPIVANLLAPEGTAPGMASRISKGYRAVAVKIDESAGVAGWIKPASRVDVVVVLDVKCNGKAGTVSKVILQNVEVLAIGQKIDSRDTNASLERSVTLLVEPKDVPKLHLAATKGKLRLAMRGQEDSSFANTEKTTDNDLFGEGRSPSESGNRSFLSRLFGTQSKIEPNKTDKDAGTPKVEPPSLAALSARPRPWMVEVKAGTRVQQVWFENDQKGARRLSGEPEEEKPFVNPPDSTPVSSKASSTEATGQQCESESPRFRPLERQE